jgi:hypothetical protein
VRPAAPAAKVQPATEPKPETKVETKPPAPVKRGLDTDVYTTPSNKRSLDPNVLENEAAPSKRTIERDPWQK